MFKRSALLVVFISLIAFTRASDSKLFPDIPGWKMNQIDRVYTSDDLWELINGAADIFLSYYFEDLKMAEYENKDQMIRVELYRHRTQDDTYGIYSAERMPDYPQVQIGAQGYKSQGVLNFFAGDYYVKIMSAGVDEADEQSIMLVAQKVSTLLNQPVVMPGTLDLFPGEGRVYLSDSYIAQNFLGYSFLHHAFVMKYEQPEEFQMFIINLPGQVQKISDQYIQMAKSENVTHRDEMMIIKDQFNGTVFLRIHKDYLVGVHNTENFEVAKDFINKTIAKIN